MTASRQRLSILSLFLLFLASNAPGQKVMRPATPEQSIKLNEAIEKHERELAKWRAKIERESQRPEWLRIARNAAAYELAGLLDPVGMVIDEMAKDHPHDEVVQAKAAWVKLAFSLTSAANSADNVHQALIAFAKSRLKGEARVKILQMIQK